MFCKMNKFYPEKVSEIPRSHMAFTSRFAMNTSPRCAPALSIWFAGILVWLQTYSLFTHCAAKGYEYRKLTFGFFKT